MRYSFFLGAAALVAGSPAPQALDFNALDGLSVSTQGPPVGIGAAAVTAYAQEVAQNQAAAAATGVASALAAKRSSTLKARTYWAPWNAQPVVAASPPVVTPAPVVSVAAPVSSGYATIPSSCVPVSWTNTFAFTADPACSTAIEVGTYCGFINPEDPCSPQPRLGNKPQVSDTPESFQNNPDLQKEAKSAVTPSGYQQSFVNYNGSVTGNGYIAFKALGSYDIASCSKFCDDTDTCTGFNIFIERDPAWNPHQCSCGAPDTLINYKCSIWGQKVSKDSATNFGEGRDSYQVVITASNGYNKGTYSPPTPPSCSKPQNCGSNIIDQPRYCMGQKTFPGPYDPSVCAAYAQSQNDINKKSGKFGSFLSMFGMNKGGCVQFQASYLEKSSHGVGTHCRLFTKKFTPSQATFDVGNTSGAGAKWGCQKSYMWDVDSGASFNWGGWAGKAKRDE